MARVEDERLSRRERKKRATRDTIHEVGISLFVTQGFSETAVTEIAEAADIAASTFYLHFSGKEELLCSGIEDRAIRLVDLLRNRAPGRSTIDVVHDYLIEARDSSELVEEFVNLGRILEREPELAGAMSQIWHGAAYRMLRSSYLDDFNNDYSCAVLMTGITIGAIQQFNVGVQQHPHDEAFAARHLDRALKAIRAARRALDEDAKPGAVSTRRRARAKAEQD